MAFSNTTATPSTPGHGAHAAPAQASGQHCSSCSGHSHAHKAIGEDVQANRAPLTDPVCGMTVTEQSEHRHEHEGQLYYFCCAHCKAKVSANPGQFVSPTTAPEPEEPAPAGTI